MVLPRAQMVQALTYSRVSAAMDGHQKWRRSRSRVQEIPGWQAKHDCVPISEPRDEHKQAQTDDLGDPHQDLGYFAELT